MLNFCCIYIFRSFIEILEISWTLCFDILIEFLRFIPQMHEINFSVFKLPFALSTRSSDSNIQSLKKRPNVKVTAILLQPPQKTRAQQKIPKNILIEILSFTFYFIVSVCVHDQSANVFAIFSSLSNLASYQFDAFFNDSFVCFCCMSLFGRFVPFWSILVSFFGGL